MKILVLGVSGMLGSMVYTFLRNSNKYIVKGTFNNPINAKVFEKDNNVFQYNALDGILDLKPKLNDFRPDFIINCIGIINRYSNTGATEDTLNAIKINSVFPYFLAEDFLGSRIIQIATDCVYSGTKGNYDEDDHHDALDVYGKTKSLGEVNYDNFLNVRCSIIGPELTSFTSLFEWFKSNQEGSMVNGFDNHWWNGVTTLQFAQLCYDLMQDNLYNTYRSKNHTIHYLPNSSVSKYELLKIFRDKLEKNISINRFTTETSVDRTLSTKYDLPYMKKIEMQDAVNDLIDYISSSSIYKL